MSSSSWKKILFKMCLLKERLLRYKSMTYSELTFIKCEKVDICSCQYNMLFYFTNAWEIYFHEYR